MNRFVVTIPARIFVFSLTNPSTLIRMLYLVHKPVEPSSSPGVS
jgi:hypothetical protein